MRKEMTSSGNILVKLDPLQAYIKEVASWWLSTSQEFTHHEAGESVLFVTKGTFDVILGVPHFDSILYFTLMHNGRHLFQTVFFLVAVSAVLVAVEARPRFLVIPLEDVEFVNMAHTSHHRVTREAQNDGIDELRGPANRRQGIQGGPPDTAGP